MEAIELLTVYKKRVDQELKKYFAERIKESKKNHSLAKEAIEMIADFTLAGGKRIRPALVYYSYLASGRKDSSEIVKLSMSIELTHSFLLIHDDIIDRDKMRHGVLTLHERYRKIGRRISRKTEEEHFGNSMAMLAGDMAAAMANQIIFTSNFPSEVIVKALNKMQEIVYNIVPGEMLDIVLEARQKVTEEEVLEMYEGKTSSYTFEGPLHLGAVLAENDAREFLDSFSAYALPLGKAFQIRDDILGLLGREEKIGKPVGSDVIEGKKTLLVIKAKQLGNKNQKKILEQYIGKKDLTKAELEKFCQVIRETGSLDYCEKLSRKLIAESLQALEKIDIKDSSARCFLQGIAQYMIKREY